MFALICAPLVGTAKEPVRRLDQSAAVFADIMRTPDKGIPRDLIEKAHCIVIMPGLKKAAFVVGGEFGRGFVTCRNHGGWSAPGSVRLEGGSVGFQIGGSETDLILLVMNQRGRDKLLSGDFTVGAEGEVAAGPVGRTGAAETDAPMRAEILSWSRSRGVFAGVAVKGATIRQNLEENEALYGRKLDNREIVNSGIAPPAAATRLLSLLSQYPSHVVS